MATFLELVNEVLVRLREDEVSSLDQTSYSRLIAYYVNDAKRQVEEAWDWDALTATFTLTIGPGLGDSGSSTRYTIPGIGMRQKNVFINNTSNGYRSPIRLVGFDVIAQREQMVTTIVTGVPRDYAWYGNNGTDSAIAVWPTPNAEYTLTVNANVPQQNLTSPADVLLVPADCVVALAKARALAERGEDGGMSASEEYALAKTILSDRIAIEQSRTAEFDVWEAA